MWRQYLAVPVPFLTISFALPLLYLRNAAEKNGTGIHYRVAVALAAASVFIAAVSSPYVLKRTPIVLAPERWQPIEIHRISEDIAERTKRPQLILTLGPLLALEGGCDIYTELCCGSIIYRIADSLSPSERRITHTAGPKTIERSIIQSPPSAVILGVERGKLASLEAPLQKAIQPDWEKRTYKERYTARFEP
jgi:hypothetical protein